MRRILVEAVVSGSTVEFGDQLAGEASMMASSPADRSWTHAVGILGGGGKVADVDATVIEIEVERLWFAFAEGE